MEDGQLPKGAVGNNGNPAPAHEDEPSDGMAARGQARRVRTTTHGVKQ